MELLPGRCCIGGFAASKGAGIVDIALPSGEAIFVVFSHMVVSYSKRCSALKFKIVARA